MKHNPAELLKIILQINTKTLIISVKFKYYIFNIHLIRVLPFQNIPSQTQYY